jgi:hypothetical protein
MGPVRIKKTPEAIGAPGVFCGIGVSYLEKIEEISL